MHEILEIERVHTRRRNGHQKNKFRKLKRQCSVKTISSTSVNSIHRKDQSLAVVIPAFNEERFIGSLVLETLRIADRVIVVDDGSKDRTSALARMAGADVLIHGRNQGKGVALENGLAYALSLDVDAIVVMDGDGQHRPYEIHDLVRPVLAGEADMVIGSRFQGVKSQIPWWRQVGQHALTMATNTASQVRSTDSQSGFRAFSRAAVESMDLRSTGFSVESELQFLAAEKQWRVVEAPISVIYEEKAKRNPVHQGLQVLNGIIKLVSQSRPLFFFGLSGAIVALTGIFWWAAILEIYSRTGAFAIGYASLATLMIILGVLAVFQGITLQTLKNIKKLIVQGEVEKQEPGYRLEKADLSELEDQLESESENVTA
jgi:glycosyltransferase involved in cell wall biosynthesis